MSEPDAVPLPRDGEVFFDVRGDARSMRVSWYANSKVAVFSIWQGNRCTGTFRLPFVDLARMIQTLQSGPPAQPSPPPSYHGAYQADPMDHLGIPATRHGYSDDGYAAAYDSAPQPGYHHEQDRRFAASPGYADGTAAGYDQAGPSYGLDHSYGEDQALSGDVRHQAADYYPAADHGGAVRHDYGTGHDYGAGHDYGTGHDYESGFAAAPPYTAERPYDGDPYPYGGSEPYRGAEPYRAGERYATSGQYGASEPYQQPRHGADQPSHGVPGYEPVSYSDPRSYHGDRAVAAGQHRGAAHTDDWLPPPAVPAEPKRGADSESVPDTAMMSVPSVPARNGPPGYR